MNLSLGYCCLALVGLGSVTVLEGCHKADAQNVPSSNQPREVQLTIYKDDFALVHESRPVTLADGRTRLHMENVSKTLDPKTVIFDWGKGARADVVAEAYDLGVPNGGALLKRLEGKPVEMLWNTQYGKPGEKIEGTLEASQDGSFVIRSGDRLYVNPNGTIVASGDQSLVTMPQISVEVDSKSKQDANLGFAYQTRSMSWSADYVGRLAGDADAMDLECWATLENHTGIDYPDAKITLVAGAPNRATMPADATLSDGLSHEMGKSTRGAMGGAGGIAFAEPQAVGELYAYKVPAAATVGQEQMNRVRMLSSEHVPIKKDYSVRVDNAGYGYYYPENGNPVRQNAQLSISFVNDEKANLGMPLPAGAVRIYDSASSDSTAFVGAAGIGDTPKNQHVNLTLSKVFDVYTDSRTVKTHKVDKHTIRTSFETVIHNEKKSPVDVRIVETFYNRKHLVGETFPGKQIDAATRQWTIHVQPGGQATLAWTADFGY